MKLLHALVILPLLMSIETVAQSSRNPSYPFTNSNVERKAPPQSRKEGTAAKTTGMASRLVAVTNRVYMTDSSAFIRTDTSHASYSGQRGGDLNSDFVKFDNGYMWIMNNGLPENHQRYTQTFDASDNIITSMTEDWVSNTWTNYNGSLFIYDAANRMTTETEINWNGSSWDSSYKYTYTYDPNGQLVKQRTQVWTSSAWEDDYTMNYIVDANGNTMVATLATWNNSTTLWDSTSKTIATYNGSNLVTTLILQNWMSGNWQNNFKVTTSYDVNNNVVSRLQQNWSGGQWVNSSRETITLLNNDPVNSLHEQWQSNAWANYYNEINTFDANHNLLTNIFQTGGSGGFVNHTKTTNTYNAYNQLTYMTEASWLGGAWTPENSSPMVHLYYEEYTITDVDKLSAGHEFSVYPVPASNYVNITTTWDHPQPFTVSVLNMQGRLLMSYSETGITAYSRKIDISQLPAGNYLVRLAGVEGKTGYRKFSVVR